uniref:FAM124 domain-containing protein n=1 Tax=Denticeps clupeoides TaxID=299321 RepID=A0AAY4D7C5_9TELE
FSGLMEPSPVTVHLLHTLDRLLKWVSPDLRLFHVSERAAPLSAPPSGPGGLPRPHHHPLLHEALGEERILHVLDFLQRTPWTVPPHGEAACPAGPPARDFYSLGAGMPVWGVRPVHCGAEVRARHAATAAMTTTTTRCACTRWCLQRRAEEQKAGFCWFTLAVGRGLSLQLALKQLAPRHEGGAVPVGGAAVRAAEMGQLVPLLPNPCSPISATRWQTEDLDGNKILFQVLLHPHRALEGAPCVLGVKPCCLVTNVSGWVQTAAVAPPHSSSCHSSQRSSPAPSAPLSHASGHSSLSLLLPRGDEPETNVDTGCTVLTPRPARPPTEGDSALETLSWELSACLPAPPPTYAERSHAPNTPDHTHRTPPDEFFI